MSEPFSTVADDFFVNLNLQTTLSLPGARETILQFCEVVQKQFPAMTSLYQRDTGEYVLEGDRESGRYQWLELQSNRLSAGSFNPASVEDASRLHRWLLERSVYFLGIGGLDVECLDVMFGFNLDYLGNRDGVVGDALMAGSALTSIAAEGAGRCIECEPSIVFAMEEDCCLQARLAVETRSSSYQVRTGNFSDDPISVYLTVRRYPRPGKVMALQETFAEVTGVCEDLAERIVLPQILRPIAAAIAGR
ncbi:MAG: hypothetical protein ACYS8X_09660 [Planctomycetota bacterium]|jgi:hypothetical protein